jgi:hypothetical protein
LKKTPNDNGKDQPCHTGHGRKQTNLKIGRPQTRQKNGQKWCSDIRDAHPHSIDLHITKIRFLKAKFRLAQGLR